MKNKAIILLILAILSLIAGVLISKMSFIGKIGITFLYDEYTILKSWWKTSLLMFIVQVVLFAVQTIFQHRSVSRFNYFILSFFLLIIGFVGLYLSYIDFTKSSHRLMSTSFHVGVYLFWVTWILNCGSFLIRKKRDNQSPYLLFRRKKEIEDKF